MSTELMNKVKVNVIAAIVAVLTGLPLVYFVEKKPDSMESARKSKVDVVFVVDVSGSMCVYQEALMHAIDRAVQYFSGADHRFALVAFPSLHTLPPYETFIGLANTAHFSAALDRIGCGQTGGNESSYDVVLALADPADPAGIGWRTDAVPILIMVTDEPGQSLTAITELEVAARIASCSLPGCRPGDSLQMFILTRGDGGNRESWDAVVADDPGRLMQLKPDKEYLLGLLRIIFRNTLQHSRLPGQC